MEPVEIAAGTLQLRPWNAYDVEVISAALSDPAISKWAPGRGIVPGDAEGWLAAKAAAWADDTGASFAVMDATSGEVYGHIGLKCLDISRATARIGYWTMPAARGKGVAGKALQVVSRWAFGALGLVRIDLHHAADNVASCRVAERGGYLLVEPAEDGGHLHTRLA